MMCQIMRAQKMSHLDTATLPVSVSVHTTTNTGTLTLWPIPQYIGSGFNHFGEWHLLFNIEYSQPPDLRHGLVRPTVWVFPTLHSTNLTSRTE